MFMKNIGQWIHGWWDKERSSSRYFFVIKKSNERKPVIIDRKLHTLFLHYYILIMNEIKDRIRIKIMYI